MEENYHGAFIKLYGAAGAALEELAGLGEQVAVPEVVRARWILQQGIDAAAEQAGEIGPEP